MKHPREGYLYIVCGEKGNYLKEAAISAISLKKVDSRAHITLIVDRHVTEPVFDQIIVKEIDKADLNWYKKRLRFKAQNIYNSPYERTIFLDTDTYFCDKCSELFGILDYYDICIAEEIWAIVPLNNHNRMIEGCYAYNSGVLVFKKNEVNKELFSSYASIYEKEFMNPDMPGDQDAFSKALLTSKARVCVLPNIYNARTNYIIGLPPLKAKNYTRKAL
jgi:lipopolysaccharide biosynthesis glycosyltransferase